MIFLPVGISTKLLFQYFVYFNSIYKYEGNLCLWMISYGYSSNEKYVDGWRFWFHALYTSIINSA